MIESKYRYSVLIYKENIDRYCCEKIIEHLKNGIKVYLITNINKDDVLANFIENEKDIFTINLIATIDSPYYYKREILFNGIPLPNSSTRSADILTSVFLDYVFPRKVARNSFFNLNLSNYYLKLIESSLKGEVEIGDWSYYHRISIEEFLDVANESCNGDNILKNLQIDNHCRLKRTELFDFNCEEEIRFNFQCFLVYNKLLQIVCEMEEEDSNYPLFIDRFFDFIDKDYLVFIEELRKTDRQVFIFTQYRDSKIPELCDEFC